MTFFGSALLASLAWTCPVHVCVEPIAPLPAIHLQTLTAVEFVDSFLIAHDFFCFGLLSSKTPIPLRGFVWSRRAGSLTMASARASISRQFSDRIWML